MATNITQSALRIENPSDYDRIFQDAFNAGDLEGLVSLYEPDAIFIQRPGRWLLAPIRSGRRSPVSSLANQVSNSR
jgi:hypothetical protein